jgi:hypothetical protein
MVSSPSSTSSPTGTSTSSSLPDMSVTLSPNTFAGMVEQGLLERFEEQDIQRVLASWRLMDTDFCSCLWRRLETLVVMDRGRWDPVNANLFPKTAKAVHDSGVPSTEVFFASMNGPSAIKNHKDFTNFVLTSHLALDIPYSGENKCGISVGDKTREWIDKSVMVLDTSLMYDAVNESDEMQYILMLRLWHPDLTPAKREALQFTYIALKCPDWPAHQLQKKSLWPNGQWRVCVPSNDNTSNNTEQPRLWWRRQ